jgi:hypothetical protein
MKTTVRLALTVALALCLAGCGGSSDTGSAKLKEMNPNPAAPAAPAAPATTAHGGTARQPDLHAVSVTTPSSAAPAHFEARIEAEPQATMPEMQRAMVVPAGTRLELEVLDALSSKTSAVGQSVRARVANAVSVGGEKVIPAGSMLSGTVEEANPADRFGGISSLALRFDSVERPDGSTLPVQVSFRTEVRGEKKKDTATIAGATAGGAILGRILKEDDRSEGTKNGAMIGAAVGTVVAASTKGNEVDMPAGTLIEAQLDAPATF